jgi:hypothetical protein
MSDQDLIQEQGTGPKQMYRHCARCKRAFKVAKDVPYGPVCLKKMQSRMNEVEAKGTIAPSGSREYQEA